MQAGLATTQYRGGAETVSRSEVKDPDDADLPIGAAGGGAPAGMIGNVEIASDGKAGVVVAATIVGYVPPAGLMVQVQLETREEPPGPGDDPRDIARAERGLPPEAPGAIDPAVRMADELTDSEQAAVERMQARDASVRREEQAHAAAAGAMAGPIQYEYGTGPDGRRYVVNGKVSVTVDAPAGDPETAARNGRRMAAAAMSAQAPSAADYAAAADGYKLAGEARRQAAEAASALSV